MRRLLRRASLVALLCVLLLVVAASIPTSREWLLHRAGLALIAEDPLTRADLIVLSVEAGAAGVLEASQLVRQGIADRVAVFTPPPEPALLELDRRGIRYQDPFVGFVEDLTALGVSQVVPIPEKVAGTEDTGPALTRWCHSDGCRTVVVVCSPDHSRRIRRVLRRAVQDQPLKIIVRPARHAVFQPANWWRQRASTRIQLEESAKLLLDVIRHPLS